jgi:hypothetical protein
MVTVPAAASGRRACGGLRLLEKKANSRDKTPNGRVGGAPRGAMQ